MWCDGRRSAAPPGAGNPVTTRLIHHVFALDQIVRGTLRDTRLLPIVTRSYFDQRRSLGIRSGFLASVRDIYRVARSIFFVVKFKTLEMSFGSGGQEAPPVRQLSRMERWDYKLYASFNIMEAVVHDFLHGRFGNARAGLRLAFSLPRDVRVVEETRQYKYDYPARWTALYQSWNLAYMTGALDNLDRYYPKLLVPAVMAAEHEDFLDIRSMALWITFNAMLLRMARGRAGLTLAELQRHCLDDFGPADHRELVARWGRFNRELVRSWSSRKGAA